ncbi:hypothetical protein EVA_18153 [gut metagenome]|uniref:Uncharacterized protein n=1 Tax=gut metagenome TaxID=749906 RepID=J9FFP6_9ZZZZ
MMLSIVISCTSSQKGLISHISFIMLQQVIQKAGSSLKLRDCLLMARYFHKLRNMAMPFTFHHWMASFIVQMMV